MKYVGIVDMFYGSAWALSRALPMASLPVWFFLFTCVIEQSERSSELSLQKGVMSIQRGCFRQASALIRKW